MRYSLRERVADLGIYGGDGPPKWTFSSPSFSLPYTTPTHLRLLPPHYYPRPDNFWIAELYN